MIPNIFLEVMPLLSTPLDNNKFDEGMDLCLFLFNCTISGIYNCPAQRKSVT